MNDYPYARLDRNRVRAAIDELIASLGHDWDPNRCDNPQPHPPHTWIRLRLVGQTRDHLYEETDCPGLTGTAPFEYTGVGWVDIACQTRGCTRGWLIPHPGTSGVMSADHLTDAERFVHGRDGWYVVDGYARCPDHTRDVAAHTLRCAEPGCHSEWTVAGATDQADAIARANYWTLGTDGRARCASHPNT